MVVGDGHAAEAAPGDYVAYVGRISPEKGVTHLLAAARSLSDIPFKAAGGYDRMPHLPGEAPDNVEFLGQLGAERLSGFYSQARMLVLPSTCFEGFPMTIAEAMVHGKPVICSQIGGLPEIVDDGVTGLLFDAGNVEDLVEKIRYLWDRPDVCRKMGHVGREMALREYSPEKHYERLMAVYEKALDLSRRRWWESGGVL
jgi:glycosyltransferase involved in cell wall biosynthesis